MLLPYHQVVHLKHQTSRLVECKLVWSKWPSIKCTFCLAMHHLHLMVHFYLYAYLNLAVHKHNHANQPMAKLCSIIASKNLHDTYLIVTIALTRSLATESNRKSLCCLVQCINSTNQLLLVTTDSIALLNKQFFQTDISLISRNSLFDSASTNNKMHLHFLLLKLWEGVSVEANKTSKTPSASVVPLTGQLPID